MSDEFPTIDETIDSLAADMGSPEAVPETASEPSAPELPPLDVPDTWTKEAAAGWSTLPRHVQEQVLKREKDIFEGINQYKERASIADRLREVVAPYSQVMSQYQVDPIQQIGQLLSAHYTLALGSAEQKQRLFERLAADYGVTFTPADPPYQDPQVAALQSEINTLKSQLTGLSSQGEAVRLAEVQKSISTFAADPKNLYFNELVDDMTALVNAGLAGTVEEAYQQAIWRNPAIREKEIARLQGEKVKESAAKAAEARKATSVNIRTNDKAGGSAAPLGSIDDTLKQALAEIRARA